MGVLDDNVSTMDKYFLKADRLQRRADFKRQIAITMAIFNHNYYTHVTAFEVNKTFTIRGGDPFLSANEKRTI